MTDANTQLKTRKALRAWSKDKPEQVRNLVWVLCGQLFALQRAPNSDALKRIVADTTEQLRTANRRNVN